jgi:electron transfer flavoprotein-quinone oxidoreductase
MMPKLATGGALVTGDAAALLLGTGLILEGANFAIASGMAAAQAALEAKEKNDFSAGSLSRYEQLLKESFVLQDLNTFRGAPAFLKNRRIYELYPELAFEIFEAIFQSDGMPRKGTLQVVKEIIKRRTSMSSIVSDLWKARKAI